MLADEAQITSPLFCARRQISKGGQRIDKAKKRCYLLEVMHRNIKYSCNIENAFRGLGYLSDPDDYVVILARDIWQILNAYPVKGVNSDQALFQKGEAFICDGG